MNRSKVQSVSPASGAPSFLELVAAKGASVTSNGGESSSSAPSSSSTTTTTTTSSSFSSSTSGSESVERDLSQLGDKLWRIACEGRTSGGAGARSGASAILSDRAGSRAFVSAGLFGFATASNPSSQPPSHVGGPSEASQDPSTHGETAAVPPPAPPSSADESGPLQDDNKGKGEAGQEALRPSAAAGDASRREASTGSSVYLPGDESLFLNTNDPFCMIVVGLQGTGKSHTMSVVLEACLLTQAAPVVTNLATPLKTLVLHYSSASESVCEALGLAAPSSHLLDGPRVPRVCVLVSPTYYKQRERFYAGCSHVRVVPLLFNWVTMKASHLKTLMRITDADNQLYMASILNLLRGCQRSGSLPPFPAFLKEAEELCQAKGQGGPLNQRLALLSSLIAQSPMNKGLLGSSIDELLDDYDLVVADLTDPLLSSSEANAIFRVLVEQFQSCRRGCGVGEGKLLFMDEAHRYMGAGEGVSDGLSEAIVNAVRNMRHDGMRIAISTQSPKTLAPEVLELVSLAVLHNFHSEDWWHYLSTKLPLPNGAFEAVTNLDPGEALVFAKRVCHGLTSKGSAETFFMTIRERLTEDYGRSLGNRSRS